MRNVLGIVTVGVVSLTLLSGCDNNGGWGPYAIRAQGGRVEVAVCDSISVVGFSSEQRVTPSSGWQAVTAFSAETQFKKGDRFFLDDPLPGASYKTHREVNPERVDMLSVSFYEAPDAPVVGSFRVPDGKLSKWLHSRGDYSLEPCAG